MPGALAGLSASVVAMGLRFDSLRFCLLARYQIEGLNLVTLLSSLILIFAPDFYTPNFLIFQTIPRIIPQCLLPFVARIGSLFQPSNANRIT